jgi:hypothetical protein
MFYIWHTLIIATFIAVAYYMGHQHGTKKVVEKKLPHSK